MGVKRYYCEDYEAMSQKAADLFLRILERNRKQMVCTATGASPTGMYRSLAEEREAELELFSKTHIVPLDEWLGLPENSESSCHFYLQKHVVSPWGIAPNCYHAIDVSIPSNEVCKKIDAMLQNHGPLDICVLGIGKNGHLGLNYKLIVILHNLVKCPKTTTCYKIWKRTQTKELLWVWQIFCVLRPLSFY